MADRIRDMRPDIYHTRIDDAMVSPDTGASDHVSAQVHDTIDNERPTQASAIQRCTSCLGQDKEWEDTPDYNRDPASGKKSSHAAPPLRNSPGAYSCSQTRYKEHIVRLETENLSRMQKLSG